MHVIDARTSAKRLTVELDPSEGKRSPWMLRLFVLMLVIHVAAQFFPSIYEWGWMNEKGLTGEYWRMFTYNFLHGGWVHLALNSLALWVFAKTAEIHFGTRGWIAIFLVSGILGGIPQMLLSPATMVGASAGIMGLYGATIAAAVRLKDIPKNFRALEDKLKLGSLVTWLVVQFVLDRTIPHIAAWAHMGGAAVGFLIGFVLVLRGSSRLMVSARKKLVSVSVTPKKTRLHGLHISTVEVELDDSFNPGADCLIVVHEGLGFWDSDRDTAVILAGTVPALGSSAWDNLELVADAHSVPGVGTVEEIQARVQAAVEGKTTDDAAKK